MIKRFLFLVCMCLICFSCNKDESITDLIFETEIEYAVNIESGLKSAYSEKIETVWEEKCGKELDLFDHSYDHFEANNAFKIVRLAAEGDPYDAAIGVIRLSSNCGNYSTLYIRMDSENGNTQSSVLNYPSLSASYTSWLTDYGIKVELPSKEVEMFFCLVPYEHWKWPNAMINNNPWGVLAVWGNDPVRKLTLADNNYIPFNTIFRYFDNSDTSPSSNYSFIDYPPQFGFKRINIYPQPTYVYVPDGIRQTTNTELAFIQFHSNPASFPAANINYTGYAVFPYFGFDYAVFSKVAFYYLNPVAQVYSDDEDSSNNNRWKLNNDPQSGSAAFRDCGFINGGANTFLYVTPAMAY